MTTSIEGSLTQRELRNESGRVLRDVAAGRSFVVTNAGTPVGRLIPVEGTGANSLTVRPARRTGG
ncbi:type II toxin-antitoxin system prevent-host-death family antitoxin [Micrococcus sp.]|uniref:type II toxin-antitoxin system Phd/YefM family antitoxin n=1 Tax=Micrococcus sp. TaxID=1271 RepID=UPI002A90D3C1|nr:type II toxin-antitoxin system prevent-host-death family antitoxin [Micrococcus sp.]MDY6055789.1 type II toxin-antitoxin system prevent-host-death family antitoxin [Micrococcus sp.]